MKRSKLSISIILLFIFIFQVASPSAAALRSGNIGSYDNVKKSAAEGKEINGIPTNVNLSEERMQEIVGQNSSYIKKNQPSVSPIIAEETSLRTETKKHFRHADGSRRRVVRPHLAGAGRHRPDAVFRRRKDLYGQQPPQRAVSVRDRHQYR